MLLIINGKEEIIDTDLTISEFVATKSLNPNVIVIELNAQIIDRANWDKIQLSDGDKLEVISFVGGG